MKRYTFDDIKALCPCYTDDLLAKLVGDGLTAEQIATHDQVSWQDRNWVLIRLMPAKSIPLFAADVAESVLHLTRECDREVCRAAIEAARGTDRDAAGRAAYAADAAAGHAAGRAAGRAAYAAYAAGRAADAAADAAYAAAGHAAGHAAYAAYAAAYAAYAAYAAKGEETVQIALKFVLAGEKA